MVLTYTLVAHKFYSRPFFLLVISVAVSDIGDILFTMMSQTVPALWVIVTGALPPTYSCSKVHFQRTRSRARVRRGEW